MTGAIMQRSPVLKQDQLMIMAFYEELFVNMDNSDVSELPTYTLVYWLQKRSDISSAWNEHNKSDVVMDLPYLFTQEQNFSSREGYEEVLQRFVSIGNSYCTKRDDYYGKGEEFLALGDLLLESFVRISYRN